MLDDKVCIGFYEGSSAAVGRLAEGFSLLGYKCERRDISGFKPREAEKYFDYVVVHGLRWRYRECAEHFKSNGVPVLVFDFGYLDRVNDRPDYFSKHWYLGFDGFGWRPEFACPEDRLAKLNVSISYDRRNPGDKIYVCGQMPGDASHNMDDSALAHYYRKLISELRFAGVGKRIVYRPHPRSPDFIPDRNVEVERGDLDECLQNAYCIVAHNSTIGLDAMVRGCPVIVSGDAYYKQFVNSWPCDVNSLNVPSTDVVRKFCAQLAYAQWTLDECSASLPGKFLMENGLIAAPDGSRKVNDRS